MKNWIIKTFFQKELDQVLAVAARQGSIDAFEKARDDVEQMMLDRTDEKAEELTKKRLLEMLSTVDYSKVVYYDKLKGIITINGERVDDGRLSNLHAEAEFMLQSDLWALIHETPKQLAQDAMFVQGESMADLQKGKSILYTLASQKKIVDLFKQYQKK